MTTEPIFAKIPLADVTLDEARGLVEDDSWFERTFPPVLHYYPQITVDGYWQLTVGVHRLLIEYLIERGLYADT